MQDQNMKFLLSANHTYLVHKTNGLTELDQRRNRFAKKSVLHNISIPKNRRYIIGFQIIFVLFLFL